MNIRLEFWREPHRWPRDTSSYIFLARAMQLIGLKLFPHQWTGEECRIEMMQSLPAVKSQGSGGNAFFAHDLLMRHHPEFERKPLIWPQAGSFSSMPPAVSFTDDEWNAARTIVERDHAEKLPGLGRWGRVQSEIINLAEAERLKTAMRYQSGGDPQLIPRSWWNSERIWNRFDLCQINPKAPFGIGSAGDAYRWIFVERTSLEAYLAVEPSQGAAISDTARFVKAAEPKVNTDGRGKVKKSIHAAFQKLFPNGGIPIGMSSQDRNDLILKELKEMGLRTPPDKRTIERAIKDLKT